MLVPHVVFALPDGTTARVMPGGIIGRTSAASLRVLDPRVSEAHALLSLRGRELRLLSLRGSLQVNSEEGTEFVLLSGHEVVLGGAVTLRVADVVVADKVLALEFEGEIRELCADAYSFVGVSPVGVGSYELVPRLVADAAAWVWCTDDGWMIRIGAGDAQRLASGRAYSVAGVPVSAVSVALRGSGTATAGGSALKLVCRTTTVHIHRRSRESLTVDARAGQLLSELALMGVPAGWSTLAELLWPHEGDPGKLRRNFDGVLARLRARLREGGVREDLVRTDKRGNIEVFLHPGDDVVDEA